MTDSATRYLDHFLDRANPAQSAVLLSAPWGAGKTHFIKAYMTDWERRNRSDPLEKPAWLYVSLFGVRGVEDIRDQFFTQTNPLLASGGARLLGSTVARTANIVTRGQAFLSADGAAFRRFLGKNVNGLPIVFDDLERAGVPICEVLGFISGLIEQDGVKIILLASEGDISADEKFDYAGRKEKVIGKTIEVRAEAGAIYDLFVSQLKHAPAREAAALAREQALAVFEASTYGNLRSLRAVLSDFDFLIGAVDPRLGESPAATARLLSFLMAVGMEFRRGTLAAEDLKNWIHWQVRRALGQDEDHWSHLAAIAEKYPGVDWNDSVVDKEALAGLISGGIIDVDGVNRNLGNHPLVVGPESSPSWRRLWHWFESGADEYRLARQALMDDLAAGNLVDPGPILHAAGLILELKDYGDDLLEGQDPRCYFRAYLDRIVDAGLMPPNIDDDEFDLNASHAGLGFMGRKNPSFREIRNDVNAARYRASERHAMAQAPRLLAGIKASTDGLNPLTDHGDGPNNFARVAILHHIPIGEFADVCLVDSVLRQDVMLALKARYRNGLAKDLGAERPWLAELRTELVRRSGDLEPPFKSNALETITHWFDKFEDDFSLAARMSNP